MPACVTFDPVAQLFASPAFEHDGNPFYQSPSNMQYLDPKKFTATIYAPPQSLTLSSNPKTPVASPFEKVPYEILDQILGLLHADTSRGIYDALRDISACSLVSRQFHAVAVDWLYRHVPVSDPYAFTKVRLGRGNC